MAEPVSIVLVGLRGYGEVYLQALLHERADVSFRLAGAVDPAPGRCSRLPDLRANGVPVYASLEDFYRTGWADLAIISSPIHYHCAQTCLALAHGSYVLCEKPPAATVQDVDRMIEARDRAGRWVAVGYQWSFFHSIQQLKADIQAGLFGSARRFKTLCLWPRDESYYRRNDWAGRLRDGQGAWILDSPLNNAMAHDLHNALYLLGPSIDRSAPPLEVVAELYRANDIENFDTAAVRIHTNAGAEVLFYGSHAVAADFGPVFSFEFARATVEYAGGESPIVAYLADDSTKLYASPESEPHLEKLWTCLAAVAHAGLIPCGLEAARPHVLCVSGAQASAGQVTDFPADQLRVRGQAPTRLTCLAGLPAVMRQCYADAILPSEAGVSWARPGAKVSLAD